MKNEYLIHYGTKGMRWGVRKAESTYRSDKKKAKANFKAGKKSASSVQDRRANRIAYNKAKNAAANKFNTSINRIAKKEGSRLIDKSKGSSTRAKAKGYAKIVAGSLGFIGGIGASTLIKNPYAQLGAQAVTGVLSGALLGKGVNDIASVSAYEGDYSMLKRKNGAGNLNY